MRESLSTELGPWWRAITAPRATDLDPVRKEFMSQIILLMAAVIAVLSTILIIIGWIAGTFDFFPVVIMLGVDAAIGTGHWLLGHKHWNWAIAILIAIILLLGLYGNYANGLVTTLNLAYVMVLLLASIFYDWKAQLAVLVLSLAIPVATQIVLDNLLPEEWLSAAITYSALLVSFSLLQWFAASQWTHTLAEARAYAGELQKYQTQLQELVADRSAELLQSNEQLRTEIQQHQETEKELEQRTRELATLLEATRAISSTIDLEETLGVIAEQMVRAIDVDGCTISRWDREADAVITWIEWRLEPEYAEEPGLVYPLSEYPATNNVLETRQPLVVQVSDPNADAAEVAYMRKVDSKSLLMLPLARGERVIGLLELDVDQQEHDFSGDEIQLVQAMANQAAVAIENSRLYESVRHELRERLRAEEALRRAHDELEQRVQERTAELAQVNEALLKSEAMLASLLESLPQNIYSKDRQGRFTFANQHYCQTEGKTRQEILGKTNYDLHPPELAEKYQRDDQLVIESEQIFETVEEHQPLGGESLYVQVIKTPLYDAGGQVNGTLGIFWDVTEQKQAEEALARERDLLHALMDNIPDTIYFKDAESRFVRINMAAAQVLGIDDPAQAIGKSDFDFFQEEHARTAHSGEQEIVRTGQPILDKIEEIRGRGRPAYWASATKVPILDQDRRVIGIIGISRDISERQRAEQEIRQSMAELQNLQHVTNALLSVDELAQVMATVAEGIVTHLGYDGVLVSRYVEEKEEFVGLAVQPLFDQFDRMLKIIGRPELKDDPTRYRLPYSHGENPGIDRVLDGEVVTTKALADLFYPWVPRPASAAAQRLLGLKALINLPMRVKGKTVGTIVAGVRAPAITADQQQALVRVASQAAVAIENARLFEAERQRSAELQRSNAFITLLSHVAARIEATPDPDRVLETLGTELKRLGITYFLALMEPDSQILTGRYVSIESKTLALAEKAAGLSLDRFRIPRERWPVQEILKPGVARYVPDLVAATVDLLPQIPKPLMVRVLRSVGVTADMGAIYLPLKVKERVLGIITVWGAELRKEDVPALMAFAGQVAVAFENARLYEQAQQEVAARLEAEEQIRASLAEKELLLKEVHHRVKNNLQVISSLLSLQSDHVKDREALESFRDSQSRIRSMALIHERLYRSPDLARIDFAEYVRNLTTYLFRVYGASAQAVHLDVQGEDVFLGIDAAVSSGLIVNELISNALKHAFPGGRRGRITVRLELPDDGTLAMDVQDDGVGLPPDLDIRTTDSLGLQLVSTLVDQLEGRLEVDRQGGTKFRISFAVM